MCPLCGRQRIVPIEYFHLVVSDKETPVLTDALYLKFEKEREAKWAK